MARVSATAERRVIQRERDELADALIPYGSHSLVRCAG